MKQGPMRIALLAVIISAALGHDGHEHKDRHQHLRGTQRSITLPGQSHHFCGDSPFPKEFEPVVSPQDYYGAARRKLLKSVSQEYDHVGDGTGPCCPPSDTACSKGGFMDAEDAKEAGLTGPLRVKFVYDLVNVTGSQLADVGMCPRLDTFQPKYCSTGRNGVCPSIICDKEEELITANKVKILHNRLEWVRNYLLKTFEVRSVRDDIVINKEVLQFSYYNKDKEVPPFLNLRYSNTDLVILMSMNPPASEGVAGWAQCLQKDQWGRCTVGLFNFVATTLTGNPAIALAPNIVTSERSTALHETMHVLGLKSQSEQTGFFRKKDGCAMQNAELFIDAPQSTGTDADGFVTKKVRHWRTPKVLEIARKQFGCDTLKGVPMEDVEMGWLAHWEARVMGPDVMSYGIGSGEAYISDITLAYFVDSGHYLVNFTCGIDEIGTCGGGRMLEATGEDEQLAKKSLLSSFFGKKEQKKIESNATTRTPGYIRWGRHQGCDFVHKKPTLSNWGKEYTCHTPNEYGCTPDNRMSAACYLRTYGKAPNIAARKFPCPPGDRKQCTTRNEAGLPPEYRYFTGKDSQVGGYGESMDYAPVRLGYWNCMDSKPSLTGTIKAVEGQDVDYSEAFDKLGQNIPAFGGQVFSSQSRCFKSSLIGFSEVHNINPDWPAYGLCYVTNCVSKNYLQFGLQGLGGIKWYSCVGDEEKQITVPLYLGTIYCPNVTKFCEMEDITGNQYAESNAQLEWIAMGVVFGVIVIVLILFCCVKPIRQKCAKCIKTAVGFERASKHAEDVEKTDCQKCLPRILIALCSLWDLLGFASVICAVAIMAAPQMFENFWNSAQRNISAVLFLGILTVILSSFGLAGARASGPTLKMCFYFYILICIFLVLILFAVCWFLVDSLIKVLLQVLWDSIRTQFNSDWVGMTSDQAYTEIKTWLDDRMIFVVPIFAFILLSTIIGIVISGVVLTCRNIMGTMSFFANILLMGISAIFFVLGGLIAKVLEKTPSLWTLSVSTLTPAVILLAVGVMGVLHLCSCVKTKGKICIMHIHLGLAGLTTLAMLGVGGYLLLQGKTISDAIENLTDDEFEALLESFTTTFSTGSWSADSVRDATTVLTQVFGVFCLVLSAVVILSIVTGAHVLHKTKRQYADSETERAGRRMALSTRFNAEVDREWLQEDVEVLPDFHLKKPPVSHNNKAYPGVEVEMRNIPVAKSVDPRGAVDAGMARPIPNGHRSVGNRI